MNIKILKSYVISPKETVYYGSLITKREIHHLIIFSKNKEFEILLGVDEYKTYIFQHFQNRIFQSSSLLKLYHINKDSNCFDEDNIKCIFPKTSKEGIRNLIIIYKKIGILQNKSRDITWKFTFTEEFIEFMNITENQI